jgi:hypothetical protein
MALDSKNNIKSVFIMTDLSSGVLPAAGTKITPGSTALDWVGITNMSNEVLTTGGGSGTPFGVQNFSKIKIIKDRGANNPLQQVVLNLSELINASAYSGAIASEQVSYVGFNGASGDIQVVANNFYTIKLEHVPNSFAYGKRPANYKYGTYQSPLGITQGAAGQENVATGLVKSLIQNFRPNRSIDWRVFSSLVNSSVTTAAVDTDITSFSLVKYSTAVTVVTTGAAAITAGTYLRFGASTASTSIYKVVTGFSGGAGTYTITLDYSWQADSATILDTDVVSVTTGTDWGIKIVGIKQKYDVNRWRQYDKVRFNTFLEGFPDTATPTAVTTTAAFDGIGVYEQVANDEYISWGDEGQIFVDQTPPQFREQDAVVGTQYNPVVIGWLNRLNSLIGAGENKGQVILYMAGGDGVGDYTPTVGRSQAVFIDVFNSWVPANLDLPLTFPDPTV